MTTPDTIAAMFKEAEAACQAARPAQVRARQAYHAYKVRAHALYTGRYQVGDYIMFQHVNRMSGDSTLIVHVESRHRSSLTCRVVFCSSNTSWYAGATLLLHVRHHAGRVLAKDDIVALRLEGVLS